MEIELVRFVPHHLSGYRIDDGHALALQLFLNQLAAERALRAQHMNREIAVRIADHDGGHGLRRVEVLGHEHRDDL